MIGYINKTATLDADQQRQVMVPLEISTFVVDDLDDAIQMTRPGSDLVVARLTCISTRRQDIWDAINRVSENGARIIEAETGDISTADGVRSYYSAVQEIAKRPKSSTHMRRLGAIGGKARKRMKVTDAEAREIWASDIKTADAADRIGLSVSRLHRLYGRRNRPAGRPKTKDE